MKMPDEISNLKDLKDSRNGVTNQCDVVSLHRYVSGRVTRHIKYFRMLSKLAWT